ncbi:hypothetical protein [Bradyrhizobium sp. Gha]|uniref:hypothetical protein n=1 Tax=Bradyrhizobium sp. Gha TaxID=1855318 RepID=UPI000B872D59|nr:hypothetical protein [Bradyrhizobium sp. Gha]
MTRDNMPFARAGSASCSRFAPRDETCDLDFRFVALSEGGRNLAPHPKSVSRPLIKLFSVERRSGPVYEAAVFSFVQGDVQRKRPGRERAGRIGADARDTQQGSKWLAGI